jgi:hypothetical protein
MFSLKLRPVYHFCDKVIIRNFRRNRLAKPGANPGLDNRLDAFKKEGLKVEDEDAEEFIEASESDFANVSIFK